MRMAALPTWGLWHHCWVQWTPFLCPAHSAEQEGAHLDQLGAQMETHLLRPRQADPCTPPVGGRVELPGCLAPTVASSKKGPQCQL